MSVNSKEDFKNSLSVPITPEIKQSLEQVVASVVDTYISNNEFGNKEFLCYLCAAIFLTYKELYPDLSIYIPFRIKSDHSFIRNLQKEFPRGFNKLSPDDFQNLAKSFPTNKISADISAATVVLDHLKTSGEKNLDYSNDIITKLYQARSKNLRFIEEVEATLKDGFIDEEEYFKIKHNLLQRLLNSTFPEFTLERTIPYQTELENSVKIFTEKSEVLSFSSTISLQQEEDLFALIDDLRSRLSDKLEYEILRETMPVVLNSPLIKNVLKVRSSFQKDSKKPNGFASLYWQLETPYGTLELQSQSAKRYYESKKGSAFHSGLSGKELDIDEFFELSNPNDEQDLSYYLKKLNSVPVDDLISDLEIPEFSSDAERRTYLQTPDGRKYTKSQRIKELLSHIKLKDSFTSYFYSQSEKGPKEHSITLSTDDYLFNLAQFVSPYMNVCSSGHTNFSSASIHHKNLVGQFSEILRKRDSITCLGNILIERLRTIVSGKRFTDGTFFPQVEDSLKIPREITRSDLLEYGKNLQKSSPTQNNATQKQR